MSDELQQVVNCWAIYSSDDPEQPDLAEFHRPQDWGDPRWMYRKYVLEAMGIRNECHCWIDHPVKEHEHLEAFSSLISQIMLPGLKSELCGRDFLAEDDFWQESWGAMPPLFDEDEDDFDDVDYGNVVYFGIDE